MKFKNIIIDIRSIIYLCYTIKNNYLLYTIKNKYSITQYRYQNKYCYKLNIKDNTSFPMRKF
jgi:hypothetical protein